MNFFQCFHNNTKYIKKSSCVCYFSPKCHFGYLIWKICVSWSPLKSQIVIRNAWFWTTPCPRHYLAAHGRQRKHPKGNDEEGESHSRLHVYFFLLWEPPTGRLPVFHCHHVCFWRCGTPILPLPLPCYPRCTPASGLRLEDLFPLFLALYFPFIPSWSPTINV